MKGIQQGRGSCVPGATGVIPASCGGREHGRCTEGHVCECMDGWTGPHCLARQGSDPIAWDAPDKIADVGFEPPLADTSRFLIAALGVLIVLFIISVRWKKKMEGWTPVPDVKMMQTGRHL